MPTSDMNIFLRRIPANTQHVEISEFISPVLKSGFLKKAGQILNIEILALRDKRHDTIEYHGLVTLDSEWSVKRAVNGLKNRRLNGRYVLVRPYHHRSWDNDPRQQQAPVDDTMYLEKRHGDRRRGKNLEVIKNVSDQFSSQDEFCNAMHHQQFQVTFIVPAEIEMALAECLVGFEFEHTDSLGELDSPDHRITRFMTELEGPERKSRRFQFFATKLVISEVLDNIKSQFSSKNIYYWITPVVEFGII
ncbi:DUF3240 domain-containing protein [Methylomonas sp. SURF-2]|uniref:DUF3240 domain-containing protein n=1 Tax=Methylomonas subterranea TaxID=2952225 RepID=A0ABT1TH89_9GAMM|nr:DUF3240 domain-containing protein [Methylomonas sp. SURF-2]MCQ8104134.1 DUF3240 domain-containing protein [Methylomonas sp. SURF-2]